MTMIISPWIIPGIAPRPKKNKEEVIKIVIEAVEQVTGYTYDELLTKNRKRDRVLARSLLYYFLRINSNITFNEIASLFNMDHSSIIHGVTTLHNLLHVNDNAASCWHSQIQKTLIYQYELQNNSSAPRMYKK
jgi:chromosomal replication initiation ATPase DnaA